MRSVQETKTLEAKGLCKSYKGRQVVKDVSFALKSGEVVGLLGPNGAGKTTSFYMVVGMVKPEEGRIIANGEDITALPMHERSRRGLAYLPQEASVFRRMTVEENLLAALETLSILESERKDRLHRLMDEFNLNHVAHQNGYTLSGGERRRVEVARALALDPEFILLDEPFAGIDPIAVADIQRMIGVLKQRRIGVLITDHNVRETLKICDFSYLLSSGSILEKGTPEEIAASPLAREHYLGDDFEL